MRRLSSLLILALMTTAVTACTPATPQPTETTVTNGTAEKHGDGVLRTDLAPIAKRYPQLSAAESVEWMGGTTGSSDIGPTTYWVDVVATLPESEIEALRSAGDLEQIDPPVLVPGMASKVPAGPFEGSPELDALFSAAGYSASVAIDAATRTVVLTGLFE